MKQIFQAACQVLVGLALLLLAAAAIQLLRAERPMVLPLLCGSMLCLALGSGGFVAGRRWGFFIWLSTAILIGMTFPTWFIGTGSFKFTSL